MAIRNRLHINHIPQLEEWLRNNGWELQATKGMWEKVRAKKGKKTIIFFTSNSPEHLSYEDKFNGIVSQFLRDYRKTKRKINAVI